MALKVECVAVGEVCRDAQRSDCASHLVPTHLPVVGVIGEHHIATHAIPCGAFRPEGTSPLTPQRSVPDHVLVEALIENFPDRVRGNAGVQVDAWAARKQGWRRDPQQLSCQ
jgi:hypothetical protein